MAPSLPAQYHPHLRARIATAPKMATIATIKVGATTAVTSYYNFGWQQRLLWATVAVASSHEVAAAFDYNNFAASNLMSQHGFFSYLSLIPTFNKHIWTISFFFILKTPNYPWKAATPTGLELKISSTSPDTKAYKLLKRIQKILLPYGWQLSLDFAINKLYCKDGKRIL